MMIEFLGPPDFEYVFVYERAGETVQLPSPPPNEPVKESDGKILKKAIRRVAYFFLKKAWGG